MNRREFLEFTGAGLGVLAASSLLGALPKVAAAPAKVPSEWDREADVVIVGYGGAGAAAAITAYDAGADVVVLEKMPERFKGGTTKVSGNMMLSFTDVEGAKKYFHACAQGHDSDIPEEMVEAWARALVEYPGWLESLSGRKVIPANVFEPEFPSFPGAESVRTYTMGPEYSRGTVFGVMDEEVQKRRIPVLYETPTTQLVWDGQVRGVIAEKAGRKMSIRARRAVILSCGGFASNPEMQSSYLGYTFYTGGNPGNTGDGIKMALSVGADLWHMANVAGPWTGTPVPLDFPYANGRVIAPVFTWGGSSYFWVDKYGERWVNEAIENPHGKGLHSPWHYYDIEKMDYSRNPAWMIFDEALRKAGPVASLQHEPLTGRFGWLSWSGVYQWSATNEEEIRRGWILAGNTIDELAAKMAQDPETRIDPETLVATFYTYNSAAVSGHDAQFHRPADKMAPLNGPFYALKLVPGVYNTQGGPRRNERAQVIDPQGKPIPRLYSAGELGSIYAWLYNGGGNVAEAIAFGRIAGRNAAKEA